MKGGEGRRGEERRGEGKGDDRKERRERMRRRKGWRRTCLANPFNGIPVSMWANGLKLCESK